MWICTVHHFYSNSEAMPQRQLLLSYLHRRKHAPNDALPLPYVGADLTARHRTLLASVANTLLMMLYRSRTSAPISPPDTGPHCQTTHTGQCIMWCVGLLPQLSLSTHYAYTRRDGSGWVDLDAWFCTKVVYPSLEIHPCWHWPLSKPQESCQLL